jgi:hypothetical protein
MSAHAFCFILLKGLERLAARPLQDFYRPSQVARRIKITGSDDIGLIHALKGWMGIDDQKFQATTPIEAIQQHWLGPDAPFSIVAIINRLRELAYLKKKNPEFHSWLSVRQRDTRIALRNVKCKLLGAGASTLFVPTGFNSTVNRLLPKPQQRRIETRFSLNALLGMPDETRKISEFKQLTGRDRITATTSTETSISLTSSPKPEKQQEGDQSLSPQR